MKHQFLETLGCEECVNTFNYSEEYLADVFQENVINVFSSATIFYSLKLKLFLQRLFMDCSLLSPPSLFVEYVLTT